MRSRFRIDDLISQDSGGVVYLGVDDETGERAALRRFFPGDGCSAGIAEEARSGFLEAIAFLSEVSHPCLRRVLEGGIDEVDGVPFVATEWVDGHFLREVLADRQLTFAEGECLVRQGLSVMRLLEQFFGEGAHWLKIHSDSIIFSASPEGPLFAFSISLHQWMGVSPGEDGLQELAGLVETACGLTVGEDSVGEGALASWASYVRKAAPTLEAAQGALDSLSLRKDERPSLARFKMAGADQGTLVRPAGFKSPPLASARSSHGVAIALSVIVAALILVGGGIYLSKTLAAAAAVEPEIASGTGGEEISRVAVPDRTSEEGPDQPLVIAPEAEPEAEPEVEPEEELMAEEPVSPRTPESVAARAIEKQRELADLMTRTEFGVHEGASISARKGERVVVTGTVLKVRETKAWLVFEFADAPGPDVLCVRLPKANAPGVTLADLRPFVGSQRHFHGSVERYRAPTYYRISLKLESLDAVRE